LTLKAYKADLHIHTCLSPCGDLKMSPRSIVAEACKRGLDIIAITDHNSAENVEAVIKAAAGKPVLVLPGMEVCTNEEIHVLALFENIAPAIDLQQLVHHYLAGENDPKVFGMQVIANEHDEVEGFESRLLIGATELSLEEVVDGIHSRNGLAIAAHVDRETYSVIGQLGFIPESVRFDALEMSSNITDAVASTKFVDYSHQSFVRNSDAHFLEHVGLNSGSYLLEMPTFHEIAKALRNEGGRRVTANG